MIDSRAPMMQRADEQCRWYARANRPVVLVGPVGSGKTTLARHVHECSGRKGTFVAVSSGELSDTLYADTLFGHVRGAFTGADGRRAGAFERAAAGTLFFDDLAFLGPAVQSALLRALEDRWIAPLGAARDLPVTCREIYAVTQAPDALVQTGDLLPDLASRLGELVVAVPGLVDRTDDIAPLCDHFIAAFVREHAIERPVTVVDTVMERLLAYSWPKNVRELRGVIERAVLHAWAEGRTELAVWDLPARVRDPQEAQPAPRLSPELVERAVAEAAGNRTEAARRLGVHRNTVARYLQDNRRWA